MKVFAIATLAIVAACNVFDGPAIHNTDPCEVPCPGGGCCAEDWECRPAGKCVFVGRYGSSRDAGRD